MPGGRDKPYLKNLNCNNMNFILYIAADTNYYANKYLKKKKNRVIRIINTSLIVCHFEHILFLRELRSSNH